MVKRVLMFHGAEICYNTLNIFTDSLAESLRKKGIEVGFINLNAEGNALANEYVREMNRGFDAVIAFNSQGEENAIIGNDNIFEYMKVPFFNWVVDHPSEHLQGKNKIIKDYNLICLDRDHVSFAERYFPQIAGAYFIPIGGKSIYTGNDSYDSFINRKYDVVFTGSHVELNAIADNIKELPEDHRLMCSDIIECMLDNSKLSTEEALVRVLYDRNVDHSDKAFKEYMYIASCSTYYLRAYIREEIIRYIADSGVKIDVFGVGWDCIDDLGNVDVHGEVSYKESVALCCESKMCFNVMPLFKNGLHDRISTAMLSGAAVMTDTSRYIDEVFVTEGDKRELLLYDVNHPELIGDMIRENLRAPDKLYEMAQRGYKKAQELMTWDKRADELLKIIARISS